MDALGNLLSERHDLAADRDREDGEVEYLDHPEIRVGAIGNEHRAGIEQERLCEVDETGSHTICAPFNKRATDTSIKTDRDRLVELGLKNWLQGHGTDAANIEDRLQQLKSE